VHLGAIDRDQPDVDQPRLGAQHQHLAKQPRQRVLVIATKARQRRMIRHPIGTDHPVGNILAAATLDPPRRALPARVGIQQQRHHHRRVIGRTTPPVAAIGGIKRRQIHLAHRVQHQPRQMTLGQPLPHIRRQQEPLLTIDRNEVLGHAPNRLKHPGHHPGLRDSLDEERASRLASRHLHTSSRACVTPTSAGHEWSSRRATALLDRSGGTLSVPSVGMSELAPRQPPSLTHEQA
jgi:hypothetical protein